MLLVSLEETGDFFVRYCFGYRAAMRTGVRHFGGTPFFDNLLHLPGGKLLTRLYRSFAGCCNKDFFFKIINVTFYIRKNVSQNFSRIDFCYHLRNFTESNFIRAGKFNAISKFFKFIYIFFDKLCLRRGYIYWI